MSPSSQGLGVSVSILNSLYLPPKSGGGGASLSALVWLYKSLWGLNLPGLVLWLLCVEEGGGLLLNMARNGRENEVASAGAGSCSLLLDAGACCVWFDA